jgi:4-hydroxy-4-methyl-2-oxoglutarate aldolase
VVLGRVRVVRKRKWEVHPVTSNSAALPEAIEALREASTGMVIDALAMAGIEGGVVGIRPARGFEDGKIVGAAATMLFAPARPDMPKMSVYAGIQECPPGSILVMDGKGLDYSFSGDHNGHYAMRHGLVGIVVFGGARDISGFRKIGMPLYCTGSATRVGVNALPPVAHNVPVEIGGVIVKPGDIIVADEDGVVVIPIDALETALENLKIISAVEMEMERAISMDSSAEEIGAIIAKKKVRR